MSRWSQEWIRSREPGQADPEILRDGWLGFAPATEGAVAAAAVRIGRTLPPSYREFLLTTDGWRHAGCLLQIWSQPYTKPLVHPAT